MSYPIPSVVVIPAKTAIHGKEMVPIVRRSRNKVRETLNRIPAFVSDVLKRVIIATTPFCATIRQP